jgi:hypothetical protein
MQLAMLTDVVRSYLETGRSWCLTGITRVRVSPPAPLPPLTPVLSPTLPAPPASFILAESVSNGIEGKIED